jgi:hypothetical protein
MKPDDIVRLKVFPPYGGTRVIEEISELRLPHITVQIAKLRSDGRIARAEWISVEYLEKVRETD